MKINVDILMLVLFVKLFSLPQLRVWRCDTLWHFVTAGDRWRMVWRQQNSQRLPTDTSMAPGLRSPSQPTAHCFPKIFSFQIFFVPRTGSAADLLNIQISGVFASAGWPSGYLSSPNIRYNLPFLPSRHLTLNLKPKLLGIVSQWLLQAVSVGTKKVLTMAWNMNWPIGVFTIHWSRAGHLDSRHLFLTIFVLESGEAGVGHPDTTELQGAKLVLSICLNCLGNVGKTTLPVNAKNFHSLIFLNSKQEIDSLILVKISSRC